MKFAAIFALALGLAMDATAVAAARGFAAAVVRPRDALLVAAIFGGMQAFMPLLGWGIGDKLGPVVAAWDHWIAFVLLGGIGGKMLWEAAKGEAEDENETRGEAQTTPAATPSSKPSSKTSSKAAPFALRMLLVLGVATSIDAFAVGITLPMLGAPLALSLATIGVTTALLSGLAVFVGRRFGAHFGRRLDVLGGLVLVGLGLKILLEHLHVF